MAESLEPGELLYPSMKHFKKEAQYLRHEVQKEAQDIKDEFGGKVESTAQEVQRLGQDIKDEFGWKVDSMAQEMQCWKQELLDKVQDIEDRLKLGGRLSSSAGGQLVDFILHHHRLLFALFTQYKKFIYSGYS